MMLSVGQVLKTISVGQNEQGAVHAFLNWLTYSGHADEPLTAALLTSFFQEALDYPHWQQNRRALGDGVRSALQALCLHTDEVFDFQEVTWPTQMEVLEIQQLPNWVDLINSYLTIEHPAPERFRIIHDESLQKLFAVVLAMDGSVQVREFSRRFFVRQGALVPLREDLALHFNNQLELAPGIPQKITTGSFMTTRFHLSNGLAFGATARGFTMQIHQNIEGLELEALPKLFFTVRRLEQHFLKRESNPFYQQTLEAIEHTIRMLRLKDEEFIKSAPDTLARSQNALDYVFVGDKLLGLLLRDLQHTMAVPFQAASTVVKQKEESWIQTPAGTLPSSPLQPQIRSDLTN